MVTLSNAKELQVVLKTATEKEDVSTPSKLRRPLKQLGLRMQHRLSHEGSESPNTNAVVVESRSTTTSSSLLLIAQPSQLMRQHAKSELKRMEPRQDQKNFDARNPSLDNVANDENMKPSNTTQSVEEDFIPPKNLNQELSRLKIATQSTLESSAKKYTVDDFVDDDQGVTVRSPCSDMKQYKQLQREPDTSSRVKLTPVKSAYDTPQSALRPSSSKKFVFRAPLPEEIEVYNDSLTNQNKALFVSPGAGVSTLTPPISGKGLQNGRNESSSTSGKANIFEDIGKNARKRFASIGGVGKRVSFFAKPTSKQQLAEMMKYIDADDADSAMELLNSGCPKLDFKTASELLVKCANKIDILLRPYETLTLLVDKLGADVNAVDQDGHNAISILFTDAVIGRLLMNRGANILQEDFVGSCALSTSFEYGIEWMYDLWLSTGHEQILLATQDDLQVSKYIACLILGGYGVRATELINARKGSLTPDEASSLLDICESNIENMKEPEETYALQSQLIHQPIH